VLVPVKAFADAKVRLAGVLDPEQRELLARWCAERVLAAAAPAPVYVVCDDEGVAVWAGELGAQVLQRPGFGLDGAVNSSVVWLREQGVRHVVVAHGDLPLAHSLSETASDGSLVLVPDCRDDGTNVISIPTAMRFEVVYGPGSFRRHLTRALAAGLAVTVRRDLRLSRDIDVPSDLTHPLVQEVLPPWLPTSPVSPPSISA